MPKISKQDMVLGRGAKLKREDGTVLAGATTAPSHAVVAAGTFTTAGGDASETITVAGALSTDTVSVSVKTAGSTPRTVTAAAAASGSIAVTMSGDPSTDHVLQYHVFRAIA